MKELFLVYRRHVIHRRLTPDDPSRRDVICAAFWKEQHVRALEREAGNRGYEPWWEEVPVRSKMRTQDLPSSVYVLFEGGLKQNDPEALEIAGPVGRAVHFTRDEVQEVLESSPKREWEGVWELPVPRQSPCALQPFPRTRYSGFPADYEFTP